MAYFPPKPDGTDALAFWNLCNQKHATRGQRRIDKLLERRPEMAPRFGRAVDQLPIPEQLE